MKVTGVGYRFLQIAFTFSLVTFAWIFFRAKSLGEAVLFIKKIVMDWNPWALFDDSLYRVALSHMEWEILLAAILVLLLADIIRVQKGITIEKFLHEESLPFRWFVMLLLFFSIVIFGIYGPGYDPKQFIYFQF